MMLTTPRVVRTHTAVEALDRLERRWHREDAERAVLAVRARIVDLHELVGSYAARQSAEGARQSAIEGADLLLAEVEAELDGLKVFLPGGVE